MHKVIQIQPIRVHPDRNAASPAPEPTPNLVDTPLAPWDLAYSGEDVVRRGWPGWQGPPLFAAFAAEMGRSTAGLRASGIGQHRVNRAVRMSTSGYLASNIRWRTEFHVRALFSVADRSPTRQRISRFALETPNATAYFEVWCFDSERVAVALSHSAFGGTYGFHMARLAPQWNLLDVYHRPIGGVSTMQIYLNGEDLSPNDHRSLVPLSGLGVLGVGGNDVGIAPFRNPLLFFGVRFDAPGPSLDLHQRHTAGILT